MSPSETELISLQIDHFKVKIQAEIGNFTHRPASRQERSRRSPAVLITDSEGDQYMATLAEPGEPQFIPGVAIRVMIPQFLGAST